MWHIYASLLLGLFSSNATIVCDATILFFISTKKDNACSSVQKYRELLLSASASQFKVLRQHLYSMGKTLSGELVCYSVERSC